MWRLATYNWRIFGRCAGLYACSVGGGLEVGSLPVYQEVRFNTNIKHQYTHTNHLWNFFCEFGVN